MPNHREIDNRLTKNAVWRTRHNALKLEKNEKREEQMTWDGKFFFRVEDVVRYRIRGRKTKGMWIPAVGEAAIDQLGGRAVLIAEAAPAAAAASARRSLDVGRRERASEGARPAARPRQLRTDAPVEERAPARPRRGRGVAASLADAGHADAHGESLHPAAQRPSHRHHPRGQQPNQNASTGPFFPLAFFLASCRSPHFRYSISSGEKA